MPPHTVDDFLDDDAVDADLVDDVLADLLFAHHPLLVHRHLGRGLEVERLLLDGFGLELGLCGFVIVVRVLVGLDGNLFLDFVRVDPEFGLHPEVHLEQAGSLLFAVVDLLGDGVLVLDVLAGQRVVEVDAGAGRR